MRYDYETELKGVLSMMLDDIPAYIGEPDKENVSCVEVRISLSPENGTELEIEKSKTFCETITYDV